MNDRDPPDAVMKVQSNKLRTAMRQRAMTRLAVARSGSGTDRPRPAREWPSGFNPSRKRATVGRRRTRPDGCAEAQAVRGPDVLRNSGRAEPVAPTFQDLARFRLPPGFRGRSPWFVQIWWIVQSTLFRFSPQFAYGLRRALLRLFGAQVGEQVHLRPSVKVTYPWKVVIGDRAWVGDDVVLYSLGEVEIGPDAVVSQRSYLCAADHDYQRPEFPIRVGKVRVLAQAWVAADVFLAPGVTVGAGAVIGARSTVFTDMPPNMVCFGTPCRPVKARQMRQVTAGFDRAGEGTG